jgi:hypothetical protein
MFVYTPPTPEPRPLIGETPAAAAPGEFAGQSLDPRDAKILAHLRALLKEKTGKKSKEKSSPDRYEPQRLTRKITWQYDGQARKVPLLRRPYID